MNKNYKILAFAGSLREKSYNKLLLKAVLENLPLDVEMEVFDLATIPMYNQDIETQPPSDVVLLKQKISEADMVMIATPEYNYSIPGVLKNALDWISRPSNQNPLSKKPVGILGASTGNFGTIRAQYQLRQVGVSLNMNVLNRPEILVSAASKKFDENGKLIDEKTIELLKEMVTALKNLALK